MRSAKTTKRISAVAGYTAQSPHILYDIRVTGRDLSDFFMQLCHLCHLRPPTRMHFEVSHIPEYTVEHLQALEPAFRSMPMQCAYQSQVSY